MTLALLSVVICLLLLSALPELAKLRDFSWFSRWLEWLHERLAPNGFWGSWVGLAIALAPILLLVLWASIALQSVLYGSLGFFFGVAVLLYALGPRDLNDDLTELAHAHRPEQRVQAQRALDVAGDTPERTPRLIEAAFQAALKRQFAPIFWFVSFGAFGVLLVRLTQRIADRTAPSNLPAGLVSAAQYVEAVLAWIPAQLMCLGLALASDFDAVARAWHEHHDQRGRGLLDIDLGFLSATACACVDVDDVDELSDPLTPVDNQPLRHAQQLIGRITMTWLVAMAMIVLTIYLA
jgi:AmpE protein